MTRKHRSQVAVFVAAIAIIAVVAAVGLSAVQTALAEAVAESPSFVMANGKVYPISAHDGLKSEISDVYLRGVCRCFDLDIEVLRKHL